MSIPTKMNLKESFPNGMPSRIAESPQIQLQSELQSKLKSFPQHQPLKPKPSQKQKYSIAIKPFTQPPKPPSNFYATSLTCKLLPSLECILLRKNQVDGVSREELYRTVQDLCTHGYGVSLYESFLQVLNYAAAVFIDTYFGGLTNHKNTPPTARTTIPVRQSYHGADRNTDSNILALTMELWETYTEYLSCVRNIFQPLDRLYVYVPQTGTILPRPSSSSSSSFSNWTYASAIGSTGIGQESLCFWSLWEVGLFALYRPLVTMEEPIHAHSNDMRDKSILQHMEDSILKASTTLFDSTTVWDIHRSSTISESSASPLVIRNSFFFLQELSTVANGNKVLWIPSMLDATSTTSTTDRMDTSSLAKVLIPTQHVMECFVQEFIKSITLYFTLECEEWTRRIETFIHTSSHTSSRASFPYLSTGTKATHHVKDFLLHVDARLQQVRSMSTSCRLNHGSLSLSHTMTNQHRHDPLMKSPSSLTRRKGIFTRIVETSLLTPLLNNQYVLHSDSLFPLLDEPLSSSWDNRTQSLLPALKMTTEGNDEHQHIQEYMDPQGPYIHLQRLYALSQCVMVDPIHQNHSLDLFVQDSMTEIASMVTAKDESAANTITSSTAPLLKHPDKGIDRLKNAFLEYGRIRGLNIVRQRRESTNQTDPDSIVTSKDALCKVIIPELIQFKTHLEKIHANAFANDQVFVKSIKTILEDVLNSSGESGEDEDDTNIKNIRQQSGDSNTVEGTASRRRTSRQKLKLSGAVDTVSDGGKFVAELLAKYVDLRFKDVKTTITPSTLSVDNALNQRNDTDSFQNSILQLFQHIHSKDVFEAFYRRDLAKRLMLNKSTSSDAERSFVSKLKAECGSGYTSKMEGMFKDIELSKDVMRMYHAYTTGNHPSTNGSLDMEVQVLTTGYWPSGPQHDSILLPPALKEQKDHFESYYNNKYQGRRIAWQHSLGNCIVRASFPKIGMRELIVSLPQALVLCCFNDEHLEHQSFKEKEGFTIVDIMKMTGLEDRNETERILQSLSLGRDGTRVLTKIDVDGDDNEEQETASSDVRENMKRKVSSKKIRRTVSDHDIFIFNSSFTSNQHRIRITNIQMKETSDERTKMHEAVSQDRLYLIDAAIVRTMKARKSLDHRALLSEVMTQVKFPANSQDIKKRIESLIEREYMERAETDRTSYNYLA